jgi:hypothetical protein
MSEEEQKEIVAEETKPETVETSQETKEEAVETVEQPKRKDAEYNFGELRKSKEEAVRRAEEAERRLHELYTQKSAVAQPRDPDDEELDKLSQDDLLTVKHGSKTVEKKLKPMQKEVQTLRAELAELRMRSKYPDVDDVVSEENIALLMKQKPQLASIIAKMRDDDPEKTIAAYEVIKTLLPPKQAIPMEKKKAIENMKKPSSVNAVPGGSAIANAFHWEGGVPDSDTKKRAYAEMLEAIKRG